MNGKSAETMRSVTRNHQSQHAFKRENQAIRAGVRRNPLNHSTSELSSRRSKTKRSVCSTMASANR